MFAPAISRSRPDPQGEYLIAINRLCQFHNRSSYTNGCVTSREASSVYTGRIYRNQNWNFQWSSEQHHVPVNSKRGHQVRKTTRAPTDEQAWSLSLSYTFPISLLQLPICLLHLPHLSPGPTCMASRTCGRPSDQTAAQTVHVLCMLCFAMAQRYR